MVKIFAEWMKKAPQYPNEYKDLFLRLARKKDVSISDGSDLERFERGKKYGSYYELYIDAVLTGLRADNQLPFSRGQDGTKFLEIGNWAEHKDITKYIFMCLLAHAPWEFEEIENLTDEETKEKANELLHIMEGFAKGGLEIINGNS